MVNFVKKTLFKTLGQPGYLRALQKSFFILFDSGYLKKDVIYKYHYFVKHLIQSGDTVVDLGGNLGYFSKIFARLVGRTGKVISIEPVILFYKALQKNLQAYSQVSLYNYALGTEEKTIQMAIPKTDDFLRTGLAHVSEENDAGESNLLFDVKMVKGSALLSGLSKIDYIKCDIEGYEEFVLPEIKNILNQFKPLVQVETWGPHKEVVMKLMTGIGYSVFMLHDKKLIKIAPNDNSYVGDYLFIHQQKEEALLQSLKLKGLA